jgi:hypothetical protein
MIPPNEWGLLNPLIGSSMLELGNKVTCDGVVYKDVFEALGYNHVSVDTNGLNGALKLDLRKPLELGTFDMITNIGTSEHVSTDYDGQVECWRNIVNSAHIGSIFISVTPLRGSARWLNHGRWYPEEGFFDELASRNGFIVNRLYSDETLVYARLKRTQLTEFQMPDNGMYRNSGVV